MTIRHYLHDHWTLRAFGENLEDVPEAVRHAVVPATVPGCVHTDLMAAGLIPEPYVEFNERALQWIGYTDWRYHTTFELTDDLLKYDSVHLICEGLDTVAKIEVNSVAVGHTENMHVRYSFNVKPYLRPGQNVLTVTFYSPVAYAKEKEEEIGALPYLNTEPYPFNFIRKMACNFGWDWGPQLVTSGIWQPIYLEAWDTARIMSVRPLVTEATAERAVVQVHVDVDGGGVQLNALLTAPDGQQYAAAAGTITVENPQLWWPRGYGDQPLYTLRVELKDGDGRVLDQYEHRIGLRTTRLNTTPDDIGARFVIEVNGQEIFCKGANWIPDDCFVTRVDEQRYRERIQQAIDANMNMLRIWGGGIYETDTFYNICDELGVMIWQDFLFACACYPEEAPFDALVAAEVEYQVTRLSKHPSLVIWNGNNENVMGYFDWGWKEKVGDRTWGAGFYFDLIPNIVARLDPTRPYWPASPYSGSMDIHPNDNHYGNRHVWNAWFGDDYRAYRGHEPRFSSEFGFQSPPTYATMAQSMSPHDLVQGSKGLAHHQRSPQGDFNNQRHLEGFFESPENFDDWIYLLQVNQARALTLGVEWFRSLQPVCMGTLYWQLNDCWPVTSWAAIDGYARRKPLWYATRRFYADRLLTFQPVPGIGGTLRLFANNDTAGVWAGQIEVSRMNFDGTVLARETCALTVEPRSNTSFELSEVVRSVGDPSCELLVAAIDDVRALWFFDEDKNLRYPVPEFDADIQHEGMNTQVTITAKTLLRDVAIFADRLAPDATISDQLVTLLPGEAVTFTITLPEGSHRELDEDTLTLPPVFQCVNRFGKQG